MTLWHLPSRILIGIILHLAREMEKVAGALGLKFEALCLLQLDREKKHSRCAAIHFQEEVSIVILHETMVAGGVDEFLHQ